MTYEDVRIEQVDRPTTLYRMGRTDGGPGLWYDAEGRETGVIHTLRNAAAAVLPMGPHPVFRDDGRHWISAAESLTDLSFWFSPEDMDELVKRGYRIEATEVLRYRRLQFPTYGHPVFSTDDLVRIVLMDSAIPYLQAAA